jgi:DNA-binding beta-propeller fold protein YncE
MSASPDATGTPETAEVAEPAEEPQDDRRRRRRLLLLLLLLLMFGLLVIVAVWYLLFRQPLPTIPILPSAELPKYATSIYGIERPAGVAVLADGSRIYVADSGTARAVLMFDPTGKQVGTLTPPAETGSAHTPVYLAVDPVTQEIYVSDRMTGAIYIYNRDGTYQREFISTTDIKGWQPLGLAFDAQGQLYVTDLSGMAAQVLVFDRQGKQIRALGADQKMSFPNGVVVDKNGLVYVTDSNNGRLLVFDATGAVVAQVGRGANTGSLGLPRGLAIDSKDRLFVVDNTGQDVQVNRIRQGAADRLDYLGVFGQAGVADGEFSYPNSVAVDSRGFLYVSDSGNGRVQVWSY